MGDNGPMSLPSPQQQPTTWDAVAPTYAEDAWQWRAYVDEAMRISPLAGSERVLDVACGPGTLAFRAAAHASQVDAVDFAPAMKRRPESRQAALARGARG